MTRPERSAEWSAHARWFAGHVQPATEMLEGINLQRLRLRTYLPRRWPGSFGPPARHERFGPAREVLRLRLPRPPFVSQNI